MSEKPKQLAYVAPVLRVPDLRRSLSYYRDELGFEIEFDYDGFYVGILRDGCRIHLQCAARPDRDQAAFEAAEHLDVCFAVEDAEALATSFAAADVAFSVPLRSMPYGREFYVRDPTAIFSGSFNQQGQRMNNRCEFSRHEFHLR